MDIVIIFANGFLRVLVIIVTISDFMTFYTTTVV